MKLKLHKVVFIFSLFISLSSYSQDGFIGEVKMFAGNFPPKSWAFCDGQLLSIAQNTALFSIIGVTYGGDGVTTFALPDLRGRVPMGVGNGPGLTARTQGQKVGSETNTLTTQNLPSHSHEIHANNQSGTLSDPERNVLAHTNTFDTEYTDAAPNVTMSPSMVGNTGESAPVNNMQPSLAIRYIICLYGLYPEQN